MQGRNDTGSRAAAADGGELPALDERAADERVMAVTAIDYCGRVLTVVSRSDAAGRSGEAIDPVSFTTTILSGPVLSGPLGQMTWTAGTWINSLRNHETAVCKLIQSIASECGV
jgi:hypothetical protein